MAGLWPSSPQGRGFEDAVLGFGMTATDEKGLRYANTNWPLRLSFPLFIHNALQYLGGAAAIERAEVVQPGQAVELRMEAAETVRVTGPDEAQNDVVRSADRSLVFQQTGELGIYEYQDQDDTERRTAVRCQLVR